MDNFRLKRFVVWQYETDTVRGFSDFLYYDHVIASTGLIWRALMVNLNSWASETLLMKYAQYMDRLQESNSIIYFGNKVNYKECVEEIRDELIHSGKVIATPSQDNYVEYLRQQFLFDIGYYYRDTACKCRQKGLNVSLKHTPDDFPNTFHNGNTDVLSIIFRSMPTVDPFEVDINYFLDFIQDSETQAKRRDLFSWQAETEALIQDGKLKVEYLVDLIDTRLNAYNQWLKKNRLITSSTMREFLVPVILGRLSIVGLPPELSPFFDFKARKLELINDEKAPGRELAYIVHVREAFSAQTFQEIV